MTKDSENRKCIVSGQVLDKEHLLRFTVLDDGQLVPDFKKKLPGVGVYVSASRDILSVAVNKNLFSKSLKRTVRISPDFVAMVEHLLKKHGLEQISLARNAGILRSGYEKVSELIKRYELYIQAPDKIDFITNLSIPAVKELTRKSVNIDSQIFYIVVYNANLI